MCTRKYHSPQTWLLVAVLLTAPSWSNAVEVAPRISDREIIESLTELKAGQCVAHLLAALTTEHLPGAQGIIPR